MFESAKSFKPNSVAFSAAFPVLIVPFVDLFNYVWYFYFSVPPSIGSSANGRNSVQRQLNCLGVGRSLCSATMCNQQTTTISNRIANFKQLKKNPKTKKFTAEMVVIKKEKKGK